MPTYEYVCTDCENHWEEVQKISADPIEQCPKCSKSTAKRQISGGNFILKGGGWYADLYSSTPKQKSGDAASGGSSTPAKADGAAASGSSGGASGASGAGTSSGASGSSSSGSSGSGSGGGSGSSGSGSGGGSSSSTSK